MFENIEEIFEQQYFHTSKEIIFCNIKTRFQNKMSSNQRRDEKQHLSKPCHYLLVTGSAVNFENNRDPHNYNSPPPSLITSSTYYVLHNSTNSTITSTAVECLKRNVTCVSKVTSLLDCLSDRPCR